MRLLMTTLLFLISCHVSYTSLGSNPESIIEKQSQLFAQGIRSENFDILSKLFLKETTILPEYHPSLQSSSLLKAYYLQFFELTDTQQYEKTAFEIMAINNEYYIELGTFEHTYLVDQDESFDYKGKYMTYWKKVGEDSFKVLAHIWGASSYFDAKNVDLPKNFAIFQKHYGSTDERTEIPSYRDAIAASKNAVGLNLK